MIFRSIGAVNVGRLAVRTPNRLTALAVARLTALTVGCLTALMVAAPAWAHGADAPNATDYRSEVRTVTPALPGLTVRAIEAGARLELTNHTGRPIEVLGYAGEPYLEIRPDGVYENQNSPATYLNRTLNGGVEPPADADPTLPPLWRRVTSEPVARWHDQRALWMEANPPPEVRTDTDRSHRVREWTVPLRDGTTTVEVHGTLDWLPPPDPALWWMIAVLGAIAVASLALVPVRLAPPAFGVLAAVGGLTAVTFAVAREADAGTSGLDGFLAGLFTDQVWTFLTGLGALAIGAYTLLRRPATDFAFALGGACLAVFAGAANTAVFARAVAPVPGPAGWARIAIVVIIATGAGIAAAGTLRLRAAARSAPRSHHPLPQKGSPVPAHTGTGEPSSE